MDDSLEQILAAGAAHRFQAEVPDALRGWLLEISWDRDRLWSLDLPRRHLPIADLRWHYELPWWRHDDHWFQVSPRQVLASPDLYPEHHRRIVAADVSHPLHVLRRRDRWLIMDGIHRLVKADLQQLAAVEAHIVSPEHLRLAITRSS